MEKLTEEKIEPGIPETGPDIQTKSRQIAEMETAQLADRSQEKEKSDWRKKAERALIGLSVIAFVLTVTPGSAKAREGFHFGSLAAQSLQQGINQGINNAYNRANQQYNAQLEVEKRAIYQQMDNQKKVFDLNVSETQKEVSRINGQITEMDRIIAEAFRKLGDPKADKAALNDQIKHCQARIRDLKNERSGYLQAVTGMPPSPVQQPRPTSGHHPSSPHTAPAPPGQWRPAPPRQPMAPPQAPQQMMRQTLPNAPAAPHSYSDEKPLPPLPDL